MYHSVYLLKKFPIIQAGVVIMEGSGETVYYLLKNKPNTGVHTPLHLSFHCG